jgi:hypothetical protein
VNGRDIKEEAQVANGIGSDASISIQHVKVQ